MSSSPTQPPTPEGLGSGSGAPHLPAGFTDTFTSRYIDTGERRQHAVIGGTWWQFSLTQRSEKEPSAVSLLKISRDRNGALELTGRAWQEDGSLSGRYWSEAVKERENGSGIFFYWKGERPLQPDAPQLEGTGEIRLESADRASGYFTTREDTQKVNARTAGVFLRAEQTDWSILDGRDDQKRVELIAERLKSWTSMKST